MRLTEVKKMKVAQLRFRLKALSLDCSGLKSALVDRLWTALQGREGDQEQHGNTTPLLSEETVLAQASPPSAGETDARAAREPERERVREFSDCGTQTEKDPDPTTSDRQTPEPTDRGRAFYEFKEEIRYKRAKAPEPLTSKEETKKEEDEEDEVKLDQRNCHLHFEVGPDGSHGQPRFWDRFPALWSGCRLNHGVLCGRVGFEVRLERKLLIKQEEDAHTQSYGLRVGWSMISSSLLLGEDEQSFAYDRRGKKVSGGKEEDFGEPFSEGDIIGSYAAFAPDGAVELSFYKNGVLMGVAFSLGASVLLGAALFPHVLCKSCAIRLQMDPTVPPWYPNPKGFTPLVNFFAEQRVYATSAPNIRALCEVLVMVGLPGSGKSHWVRTHMKKYPEKHYRLLSTEELLACMISDGERDSKLKQAAQCLTELIKLAAQVPANYILDQCNVLFSARSHKIKLFAGFRQKVVVVFPSAEEWRKRLLLRQTSEKESIPKTALLKQQASCTLPEQQEELEELLYAELPQAWAQKVLQTYKEEANGLLPPLVKNPKKPRQRKKRPYPPGPPPEHIRPFDPINMDPQLWRQQPAYWNMGFHDGGFYNRDFVHRGYEGYW